MFKKRAVFIRNSPFSLILFFYFMIIIYNKYCFNNSYVLNQDIPSHFLWYR